MLKRTMFTMVAIVAVVGTMRAQDADEAKRQHAIIGVKKAAAASDVAKDPARKWFPEAGLGLFIHWGIGFTDGHQDLSWSMMHYPNRNNISDAQFLITPNAYWALADRFNPQEYNPEKWLQAAKDAGFGYVVMTAKHHDGYALWPSKYGELSTRTKLGGRDLLQPYVDACRKVGLKIGFYYSPPDWYFYRNYMSFNSIGKGTPEAPHMGLDHEVITLPKPPTGFHDKYIEYVNGQITELMTRYGKIDILWFDGGAGPKMLSRKKIRELQPDILINNRGGKGDFQAGPEARLPTERPKGCWEHCYSDCGAWSYLVDNDRPPIGHDPANASALRLLVRLVKCRAWGGNVLANFGPRGSGEMPNNFYNCVYGVKLWMAKHRESVIDVQAGPFPEQANVPVTVRDKTWYAHLLPSFESKSNDPAVLKGEGPVTLKGVEKPQRVTMLGTGESLNFQFDNGTLSIRVPKNLRTKLVDVVKIEW